MSEDSKGKGEGMEKSPIALFGEAEKGDFGTAYFFREISQLVDQLGNPPPQSRGVLYAVQALMYQRVLIFFRVKEEGFSKLDYFCGLKLLEREGRQLKLAAICLPGVGDSKIIEAVVPICHLCNSIIITTEPDLYDYLTDLSAI